jgi:hypothetical protein
VTDYDASGTVRINDEVMTYSAVTDNGDGTLAFTVTTRGTDNTTAAAHNEDDAVQLCLRYTAQAPDDIVADLLINYANIEYQFLDLSGWDGEVSTYLDAYSLTTLITEPVEVKHLIGELSEQASFYLWWDERAQLVKMNAIRGQTTQPATLDDDEHFVADSFVIRERPDQRISQIWFYYNQRNPVLSTGSEQQHEVTNFQNLFVQTEDQQSAQYKQSQIRSVFSRWIITTAQATQTATRMARRFTDVPVEVTFELASKDRSIWVGDAYYFKHRRLVDRNGRPDTRRIFMITGAEDMHMQDRVRYTAIDATLAGFIYVILDNSTPDYQGDGSDQFNGAWISNAQGLYSNGDQGARIS